MPYKSVSELPENIRKLPEKKQRQWMKVWNSAFGRCMDGKSGSAATKACETSAFKQANGVVLAENDEAALDAAIDLVAAEFSCPLPESDDAEAEHVSLVAFAATETEGDEDVVVKRGLIFRAGDYEDIAFSVTPGELEEAVQNFQPVDLDLEHMPTILDGKLGKLEAVEIGPDGRSLYGTVRIPRWLDDVLGQAALKVSTTWTRAKKRIVKLALVLDPRVPDAALLSSFAAFAAKKHDTPHGQAALQLMHDMAARAGAVCKPPNGDASMTARHEYNAMQEIHDLCTKNGSKCSDASAKSMFPMFGAEGDGGAPPSRAPTPSTGGNWMTSLFDQFMEWAKGQPAASGNAELSNPPAAPAPPAPPAPPAATPKPAAPPAASSDADAELARMRSENAALSRRNAELTAQRIQAEATAFVDGLVRDNRVFPAQSEGLIAAYSQAAIDDETVGLVTLANGQKTSRVAQFKAVYEKAPKHVLSMEQIAPELQNVLFGNRQQDAHDDPNRKLTPEEKAKLIGLTSLGRSIQEQDARNGAAK